MFYSRGNRFVVGNALFSGIGSAIIEGHLFLLQLFSSSLKNCTSHVYAIDVYTVARYVLNKMLRYFYQGPNIKAVILSAFCVPHTHTHSGAGDEGAPGASIREGRLQELPQRPRSQGRNRGDAQVNSPRTTHATALFNTLFPVTGDQSRSKAVYAMYLDVSTTTRVPKAQQGPPWRWKYPAESFFLRM